MATPIVPLKRCSKCGEEKPATTEYFCPDKRVRIGLRSDCKICQSKYKHEYRLQNKEAISEANRKWRQKNAEVNRERKKIYRKSHPELSAKYNRKWRELHPEKNREMARQWVIANPEKVREKERKYVKNHPEQQAAKRARRRAWKVNSRGAYTAEDIQLQLKSQKNKCWHCGKKLSDKYHVDHLIPLARGGSNDARNIVIACPKCNLSKGAKLPQEWNGRLL